jgi:hypothetical protein
MREHRIVVQGYKLILPHTSIEFESKEDLLDFLLDLTIKANDLPR